MADPIAEAFVEIRPDFTGFEAKLQEGVRLAVSRVQANIRTTTTPGAAAGAQASVSTAVQVESAGAVAAAGAVTAALEQEAVATGVVTKESLQLANAKAAVASADAAVARSTLAYEAILAKEGATAEKVAVALATLTAATARQTAANERLALLSAPVGSSFLAGEKGANALRGAFIGLSRITPLTVFGLQASGVAAIIAGAAIAKAVSSAAQFEDQLNTLQGVTRISNEQLDQVRQTALALGDDVSLAAISANDAVVAITELTKAGLSLKDSLAAARGVLELAGAASISAGEAAKFVANELNAFGLAGTEATHVVDLLAAASVSAQGEIQDFAFAFQQVSSVAAQAGLTVGQTTAALTLLAKKGIIGADAGTSLRTTLLRLIPTTKQAFEFTKALGIHIDTTKTEGEQLNEVLNQYRSALLLLTPVQRVNVLNQIAGQDAVRALSILTSGNVDQLKNQTTELDQAGIAAELNAAKQRGLGGAFRGVQSQVETLGTRFGEFVDGPLEELLRGFSDTITKAERVANKISDLAKVVENFPATEIPIKFVLSVSDHIPGPLKTFLKEHAKFITPGLGPALVALDAIDALTGGAPTSTDAGGPLLSKESAALEKKFGVTANLVDQAARDKAAQFDKTFGAAARRNKHNRERAQKAAQAAIDKSLGIGAGESGKKVDFDVTAPRALRIGLLKAQLLHSESEELESDKLIRDYFARRLATIKGRGARYEKVLGALRLADAAVQGILDQMSSERKAAAAKADQKRKQDAKDAKDAIDRAQAAQLALFKLETSAIDNEIKAATLTDDKSDDRRAINKKIHRIQERIDALNKIKKKTTEQKQAVIDLKGEILDLRAQLLGLSDSASGGFTLNDLFQEAVNQFNEFSSNVTSGRVGTAASARAAVAGGILAQRGAKNDTLAQLGSAQLNEQATTNSLLRDMLAIFNGNRNTGAGGKQINDGKAGHMTSAEARRLGMYQVLY